MMIVHCSCRAADASAAPGPSLPLQLRCEDRYERIFIHEDSSTPLLLLEARHASVSQSVGAPHVLPDLLRPFLVSGSVAAERFEKSARAYSALSIADL